MFSGKRLDAKEKHLISCLNFAIGWVRGGEEAEGYVRENNVYIQCPQLYLGVKLL